ncbi:hypothetical protein AB205_0019340 [Aquarana catesbeiana]|uniref:Uncharacterized protein n=1 Tax=Aquarana catesbeiana TaxID=8400 RepID=A0A2G9SE31_AQUCT|nr:hypothetical protein AB205_0019340 [Aquarana catesbeiana]
MLSASQGCRSSLSRWRDVQRIILHAELADRVRSAEYLETRVEEEEEDDSCVLCCHLMAARTIKVEILPKIDIANLKEQDVSELTEKCFHDMRKVFFRLSGKPLPAGGQGVSNK